MTTFTLSTPLRSRLASWLKDEWSPPQLLASLNAALILFLLQTIVVLSLTALVFSGELLVHLPAALSFTLAGNLLLVATVSMLSSYGGSTAVTQDTTCVILALAAAASAAALPAGSSPESRFATVIVLLVGTTLVTGLVFMALGVSKLGGLVRFLPYPVMGGYLAGTGWLLVVGGIGVATNRPFGVELVQPHLVVRWLPALLLGLLMLLATRRWSSPLLLPGCFMAALLAFHGLTWLMGMPLAASADNGWLLGAFPRDLAWNFPLAPDMLSQVNWPALWAAVPVALPAILIGVISLLLNGSSLELVIKRDLVLNRELIAAGSANLVSGLAGGLVGYHSLSMSTLNHTVGKGRRLPGLLVALLLGMMLLGGTAWLAYVPRFALGGILVFIGLAVLQKWIVEAWTSLPRVDIVVIVAILVLIVLRNMLWGIGLGLVMTIVLFVINYSRVSSVRHELSGATNRSRVSRSAQEWDLLQARGDQVVIFELQGFIFFGTAHGLFEHVRQRVQRPDAPSPRFIVLDFRQVAGLDSTGRLSFSKLLQWCREQHIALVMTGLSGRIRRQLRASGLTDDTAGLHLFADLDHGLEWCEDQLLAADKALAPPPTLHAYLQSIVPDGAQLAALIDAMQRREVIAGDYLVRQGDEPDELFLVESGQVTAQLERPEQPPSRLETMGGGHVIGELGFFLGTRRTASVVVDQPGIVYALGRARWNELLRSEPELAATLQSLVIQLLGKRVAHLTRVVDALQR